MNTQQTPTLETVNGPPYLVFMDGSAWCATGRGFINLQESPVGFGDSPEDALTALISLHANAEQRRREQVRQWRCNNCLTQFGRATPDDAAPCPHCKCGARFSYEVFAEADVIENSELTALRNSHDALIDGCNALLGLLQLLSHRDDLPPEVLEVMRNNHRIDEAKAALLAAKGAAHA